MKKVTLETIAKQVGVSKVAVYKALNNKSGVSEELRNRIQLIAKQMGYLRSKKQHFEDLNFLYAIDKNFFLTSSEQFYTSIYYYLTCECERINSTMRIVFLDEASDNVTLLKNAIASSKERIDGIFIAGEVKKDFLGKIEQFSHPIVFIDFYSPLYNYTYIHIDNYYLSYSLTQYLIDQGHRKIGFVGNVRATSSIADRYYGYRKAISENRMEFHSNWHINQNIEHTNDLTNILPQNMPSAFVCHCDPAAHKLYAILHAKGYAVPQDVSVVSFDNTALCDNIVPTLSSAGCNKETIAKKSFSAMLDMLIDKNRILNVTLNPTFAIRNSIRNINKYDM